MASVNESIKLIIRATNNRYADFDLELLPSSTVYDLKQNIALNHPAKPVPKDQRLIFSGKLLDDTNLLNQVFIKSSSGSSFMVHLVLDSDKNATTPKSPQPKTVQNPPIINEQPPIPETFPLNSSRSNAYEQYLEELNKYQEQLQQFLINPLGNIPVSNSETEAYLQYCYTHYQMYQNLHAYQRTVIPPLTTTNTPISSQQTFTANDTNATNPPPPPAPAAQQQNNNNNNNDGEQENDLLGVLNMLVELFVLCSIIYFYSTFSRFLVVFFIFALLYLHCRGYLSLHRRRRAQPAPAPAAPEPPPAANEGEQIGEEETEPEAPVNEAQNANNVERARPAPAPVGPAEENQITTSRLLLTAVSTFFSSLIPERPQRA